MSLFGMVSWAEKVAFRNCFSKFTNALLSAFEYYPEIVLQLIAQRMAEVYFSTTNYPIPIKNKESNSPEKLKNLTVLTILKPFANAKGFLYPPRSETGKPTIAVVV